MDDLLRAKRAGAALIFLSPAFATASHPDTPVLGVVHWSRNWHPTWISPI
jgi:thiamine-phosphate pyrophosphorylase